MLSELRQEQVGVVLVLVLLHPAGPGQLVDEPVDRLQVEVIVVGQAVAFDPPGVALNAAPLVSLVPQRDVEEATVTGNAGGEFSVTPELGLDRTDTGHYA